MIDRYATFVESVADPRRSLSSTASLGSRPEVAERWTRTSTSWCRRSDAAVDHRLGRRLRRDRRDRTRRGPLRAARDERPERVVQRADVCVDIGANIGILTLLHRASGGGRTVYAFEPGDTSYAYLAQNVENAHAANVVTAQIGVYDITGTFELAGRGVAPRRRIHLADGRARVRRARRSTSPASTIGPTRSSSRTSTSSSSTSKAPSSECIEGARQTLERFRPFLVVECNPVALERFQKARPDDLVGMLRDIYGECSTSTARPCARSRRTSRSNASSAAMGSSTSCADRRGTRSSSSRRSRPSPTSCPRLRHAAGRALRRTRRTPPARELHPLAVVRSALRREPPRLDREGHRDAPGRDQEHRRGLVLEHVPNHPVCASYRFRTASGEMYEPDGIRSFFREPLGTRRARPCCR